MTNRCGELAPARASLMFRMNIRHKIAEEKGKMVGDDGLCVA
jgi:hypothetical protein